MLSGHPKQRRRAGQQPVHVGVDEDRQPWILVDPAAAAASSRGQRAAAPAAAVSPGSELQQLRRLRATVEGLTSDSHSQRLRCLRTAAAAVRSAASEAARNCASSGLRCQASVAAPVGAAETDGGGQRRRWLLQWEQRRQSREAAVVGRGCSGCCEARGGPNPN